MVDTTDIDYWSLTTSDFLFTVDGVEIGRFAEVSGLSVSIKPEPVEEGGLNQYTHQLPGRLEWTNITLKRGVTKSDALFDWVTASAGDGLVQNGNVVTLKTAAITLQARDGTNMRSWNIQGVYPVKWTGPSFAAGSDDLATEELEITHHGFTSTTS